MSTHDDLIDRAARDLTRGEPSVRLRQIVRARIERNHSAWAIWGKTVVACATALLLIVVARTLSGPRGEPDKARPTPVEQTAVAPRVVPAVEGVGPRPRVAHVTRRRVPTRALDPIAPMVIEPMTTPLMAVGTSAGVMPLEIDDLRIEPLQIQ